MIKWTRLLELMKMPYLATLKSIDIFVWPRFGWFCCLKPFSTPVVLSFDSFQDNFWPWFGFWLPFVQLDIFFIVPRKHGFVTNSIRSVQAFGSGA